MIESFSSDKQNEFHSIFTSKGTRDVEYRRLFAEWILKEIKKCITEEQKGNIAGRLPGFLQYDFEDHALRNILKNIAELEIDWKYVDSPQQKWDSIKKKLHYYLQR